jgi:hypothetical protein
MFTLCEDSSGFMHLLTGAMFCFRRLGSCSVTPKLEVIITTYKYSLFGEYAKLQCFT